MQFAIYMKTTDKFLGEGWLGKGNEVGSVEDRILYNQDQLGVILPQLVWHVCEEVKVVRIS